MLQNRERERERNEQRKKGTVMHIQNEGLHPCGLSSQQVEKEKKGARSFSRRAVSKTLGPFVSIQFFPPLKLKLELELQIYKRYRYIYRRFFVRHERDLIQDTRIGSCAHQREQKIEEVKGELLERMDVDRIFRRRVRDSHCLGAKFPPSWEVDLDLSGNITGLR